MDDDEFKKAVLERFDDIDRRFDQADVFVVNLDQRIHSRMDAIVARLDEQDPAYDRLNEKVDRLATAVRDSLAASEQAWNAITPLSRRTTRLEQPND